MFKEKITYGYGDVCILDSITSDIEHRSDCNTKKDGMLPIFTAPMSSVLNEKNYSIFQEHGIIPIIPRSVPIETRDELAHTGVWVSYSLNEFINFVERNDILPVNTKICIDLAKGNLTTIFDAAKKAKEKFGENITLMSGNIANPKTYKEYCRAGIDYVRLGIGGGKGCFDDGTLVTMHDGTKKNIEDVVVGDKVLTASGGCGTVTSRIRYKHNGKKIKINNEIVSTDDHKYLVIDKKDKEIVNENNLMQFAFWVEAKNLEMERHLLVKIKK